MASDSSARSGRTPERGPVEELALAICQRVYFVGGGCACQKAGGKSVCTNMLDAAEGVISLVSEDGWPKFDPANRE